MDKISIIIPVYHVQEYIGRCLESILLQTYSNFEVLCVEDGPGDKSGEICERYARQDNRIRVFHPERGGVGHARNYALSRMEGEWFAFLDGDDWIEPEYLEILYRNAREKKCEISACAFQRNATYCLGHETIKEELRIYSGGRECIHAYICPEHSLYGMVWNKLYRRDVFGDIRFDTKIRVNEDCLYTQQVMERCSRACVTDMQLYHWFYRKDSACHSRKTEPDFTPAEVFLTLYEKNRKWEDAEADRRLKRNYVLYVVKILMYGGCKRGNREAEEAVKRSREWFPEIRGTLNRKEKCKTLAVLKFWGLL